MHVVATAGHVDHGKSTLVKALTGADPDRLAEERRRGLTIELGYAWCTLPSGRQVAFVDVPGHERFLGTMLAGVGPVPVALLVIAADGGWMPQTEEHLAALHALNVRHGLVVVSRSDLADPQPVLADARRRLGRTSLAAVGAVAVSAVTGVGMPDLVDALDELTARLPPADRNAPVRCWIDRAFTARGSGVVVTGTLNQGHIDVGDVLDAHPAGDRVRVRALQTLQRPVSSVTAVARVAVNLRGADRLVLPRGTALLTPGRWTLTAAVDVRLEALSEPEAEVPRQAVLHIGAAHVGVTIRSLARADGRVAARLRLRQALPLHVGDVALLRDPGQSRPTSRILARAVVLDVSPTALTRRGAASYLGRDLLAGADVPDAAAILARHGMLRASALTAMGVHVDSAPTVGDWFIEPGRRADLRKRLVSVVLAYHVAHPLEAGMPAEAARRSLGVPDRHIVEWLVKPPLRLVSGRITARDGSPGLPAPVARAVEQLEADLTLAPFSAPHHQQLVSLGLDRRALAAAEKAGRLIRVAEGVVLLPSAVHAAVSVLRDLPQPFTTAEARQALNTSRRVAVPLLELLDRHGHTERVDELRRRLC